MRSFTKEDLDRLENPPTAEQLKNNSQQVCKRVFDWQEKSKIHAWDAELLEEEVGVVLTQDFRMQYTKENETTWLEAEFVNDGSCEPHQGVCGNYILSNLGHGAWRVDRKEK